MAKSKGEHKPFEGLVIRPEKGTGGREIVGKIKVTTMPVSGMLPFLKEALEKMVEEKGARSVRGTLNLY
jgi:hypothetical protein